MNSPNFHQLNNLKQNKLKEFIILQTSYLTHKQMISFLYGYAMNNNQFLTGKNIHIIQTIQSISKNYKILLQLLSQLLRKQFLTKKKMAQMFLQIQIMSQKQIYEKKQFQITQVNKYLYQLFEKRLFAESKQYLQNIIHELKQKRIQIVQYLQNDIKSSNYIPNSCLNSNINLCLLQQTYKIQQFQKQIQTAEQVQQICQFCCMDITTSDTIHLKCNHMFHKSCTQKYYQILTGEGCFQIKCPRDECQQQILEIELKNIICQNSLKKYKRNQLNKYAQTTQNTQFCKSPNCQFLYQHQKQSENLQSFMLSCPLCKHIYCMSCSQLSHGQMTCQENKDQLFQNFLQQKGKKYKRCPKCKFWVDNWRGCSTIKCRCGTQFCYKCGQIGCPHGKCNNISTNT